MDGKLLGLARKKKEALHNIAVNEADRRKKEVYAKVPEMVTIDKKMASLVGEVVMLAMGSGGRTVENVEKESIDLQAKKAELLVENGWPMDYLDGAWSCPKCCDTGYIEGKMCSCLKELYEQERTKDLSALFRLGEETFGSFDLNLYDNKINPRTNVSPRQIMELIYGTCYDYAIHFDKKSPNLLFRGSTGLGKTFLSACIAKVVSEKGFSVVYETAVDALGAYEKQKFGSNTAEVEEATAKIRRLTESDLVILDDLGTEMVTELTKSALYTIINSRLISGKKTIVSTNLGETDLLKKYTPAISSRLEGEYMVLEFAGTDVRIIKKERGLT